MKPKEAKKRRQSNLTNNLNFRKYILGISRFEEEQEDSIRNCICYGDVS